MCRIVEPNYYSIHYRAAVRRELVAVINAIGAKDIQELHTCTCTSKNTNTYSYTYSYL